MGAGDIKPPEGEIAKIGVKRRFGVAGEKTPPGGLPLAPLQPQGPARDRQARMGKGIALAGPGQQGRGPGAAGGA